MSSRLAGRSRLALRTATLLVWSASLLSVFGRADTPPPGEQDRPLVVVAEYDGIIHPVAAEFVEQAILAGEERGAAAVVLVLRTPGGLLDSTRDHHVADDLRAMSGRRLHRAERLARGVGRLPDHDRRRRGRHGAGHARSAPRTRCLATALP